MDANGAVSNAVAELGDGVVEGKGGDSETSQPMTQVCERLRGGAAEGRREIPQVL